MPPTQTGAPERRTIPTLALFILLGTLWGASFLLIKIGLEGLSPTQVGISRIGFGAITLAVIMVFSRRQWPTDARQLAHLLVLSFFMFVFPITLFSWAGQYIPSALSAIINATTPLMTLAVSGIALRSERLRVQQVIGVLIGAAGVLLLVSPWQSLSETAATPRSDDLAIWAIVAGLGATLSYAIAFTWMRRFLLPATRSSTMAVTPPLDALSITATQMAFAFLILLAASPWSGVFSTPIMLNTRVVTAILILGIFGTGIGYLWNTMITAAWGPTRASQVTYLTPMVGVVLGTLLLGETLHWYEPIGGLVVLIGIAISQRGASPAPSKR